MTMGMLGERDSYEAGDGHVHTTVFKIDIQQTYCIANVCVCIYIYIANIVYFLYVYIFAIVYICVFMYVCMYEQLMQLNKTKQKIQSKNEQNI